MGKELCQPHEVGKGHPGPGETALGSFLKGAVTVQYFRADTTDLGVVRQVISEYLRGVLFDNRIRIQGKDVIPGGGRQPLVKSRGEAPIMVIADDPDFREQLRHHLHRTVVGIVIHQDNLALTVKAGLPQRLQALLDKLANIVADDNDGKGHRSGGFSAS